MGDRFAVKERGEVLLKNARAVTVHSREEDCGEWKTKNNNNTIADSVVDGVADFSQTIADI
jgi:hypothetical protein